MLGVDEIAKRLGSIGFCCRECGGCCRRVGEDSNLVLVGAAELREIMAATGMKREEIVEPYPEFIRAGNGGEYTLAWCLRRTLDACIFLKDGRCSIYEHRPWICRTYPFMLVDDDLMVSECPGLGASISPSAARDAAADLCRRQAAEAEEEAEIREIFREAEIPPGKRVVIDSEGMKVLDG